MFRVKICGITNKADAMEAARLGADAVGLNFYRKSPRRVVHNAAYAIAWQRPPGVHCVGVFVNENPTRILELVDELSLDYVQLHGDEPPQMVSELRGPKIIRAFRCGDEGLAPAKSYLDECARFGRLPSAVLVDAAQEGAYGGTGRTANWNRIAETRDLVGEVPLILAGGLTCDNVSEAIRLIRPNAVDVASGVESTARRKDSKLMQRFIEAARSALDAQ